jgi:hypothetical protein
MISVADMMQHVHVLSERYPRRHTGEPQEREAALYIGEAMQRGGEIDVQVREIPVMGWELMAPASLRILEPVEQEIEMIPFIFSGSTPSEGLEGDLVRVGPTLIVGIIPPWEKYALVDPESGQWRAYIVGRTTGPAITQSGPPAGYAGTEDGPHYTWPSCIIGHDDLQMLQAWEAAGKRVRAHLSIRSRYKPGQTSYLVEGVLKGRARPDDAIVIGAHHDCQGAIGFPTEFTVPGACDNASGVGAVLEMARYYREVGHPCSLWFVTFGGEEWNLTGSRDYVRTLIETGRRDHLRAAVILDQFANGETLKFLSSGEQDHIRPRLDMATLARAVVAELDLAERYPVEFYVPPFPGSDHWPFYVAGVPSLLTAWDPIPHYHRNGDRVEACDRDDKYAAALAAVQAVIHRLGETNHSLAPQ